MTWLYIFIFLVFNCHPPYVNVFLVGRYFSRLHAIFLFASHSSCMSETGCAHHADKASDTPKLRNPTCQRTNHIYCILLVVFCMSTFKTIPVSVYLYSFICHVKKITSWHFSCDTVPFAQRSNVKKHLATHKVWPRGHAASPLAEPKVSRKIIRKKINV